MHACVSTISGRQNARNFFCQKLGILPPTERAELLLVERGIGACTPPVVGGPESARDINARTRAGEEGGGRTHVLLVFNILAIDHASPSRWSTEFRDGGEVEWACAIDNFFCEKLQATPRTYYQHFTWPPANATECGQRYFFPSSLMRCMIEENELVRKSSAQFSSSSVGKCRRLRDGSQRRWRRDESEGRRRHAHPRLWFLRQAEI